MAELKTNLQNYLNCLSNIDLITTKECLRVITSRTIGYIHLFLSFTVKIPQIKKIYSTKCTKGLSDYSIYSDLFHVVFVTLYYWHATLPFHTWAGSIVSFLSNFIILLLFWFYSETKASFHQKVKRVFFLGFLLFFIFLCITDGSVLPVKIPNFVWWIMINSKLPLVTISRFSQILKIVRTGQVKAVSETTYLIKLVKNASKTSMLLLETKNLTIIINHVYSGLLGLLVYICIKVYRKKESKSE